jgi:hypothetical protein
MTFAAAGWPDLHSIQRFARKIGVAPGIVVGRLQHERRLHQAVGNDLRARYQFAPSAGDHANT